MVPVPLHYFRLVRRGFNQSAWLAALSRARVKLMVDALKRGRRRRSRAPRTGGGECRAFQVAAKRLVEGRKVLVYDVLTTGATAEACTGRSACRSGMRRCCHTGACCGVAGGAHIVLERFQSLTALLFGCCSASPRMIAGQVWIRVSSGASRVGAC
jgi:hypothetical protein